MMKMVFMNYQFRSISGKEALSVMFHFILYNQKFLSDEGMSNDWEDDKYHTPYYPLLSDQYLTVNNGILESLEKEYVDKQIHCQVHSSRPKKE